MKTNLLSVLNFFVTLVAPPSCYLAGTEILTEDGPCKIEDLKIGALLVTQDGSLRPVKWVGRRTYRKTRTEWLACFRPVKISADAMGQGLPVRDLYVSQGHEMFVDGKFIAARHLINGTTIVLSAQKDAQSMTYLHVATEAHEIIMAEGQTSETLRSRANRIEKFENFGEYLALYPHAPAHDLPRCAPAKNVSVLEMLRKRSLAKV